MSNRICGILLLIIGVIATKVSGDGTGLIFLSMLGAPAIAPTKNEIRAISNYLHKARVKNKTYRFRPAIF